MQSLLYKTTDPHNVAYLRYYVASMHGKIPEFIESYFKKNNIQIENMSFASLHQHIVTILQKECAATKVKKIFKK